jgi:hypothetical protein
VTLSVRYANLPNNCKLELIKAEKSRVEQEVVIALQLEISHKIMSLITGIRQNVAVYQFSPVVFYQSIV